MNVNVYCLSDCQKYLGRFIRSNVAFHITSLVDIHDFQMGVI